MLSKNMERGDKPPLSRDELDGAPEPAVDVNPCGDYMALGTLAESASAMFFMFPGSPSG